MVGWSGEDNLDTLVGILLDMRTDLKKMRVCNEQSYEEHAGLLAGSSESY